MASFFSQNMPNVRLIRLGGGYIAWLDFSAYQLSAEELKNIILDKAGVGLTWGETFGPKAMDSNASILLAQEPCFSKG
ncbi:hypothetical protein [Pectobacterium parmentieri]|uniref:hypothetical protein n=1 Tax=Pectobacterium parmentieri TaxID=1905730 RepID=UPI0018E1735F|nr:hypothetical protein [Pectobacterium parmentieri]QQA77818.1 hypothetical protein JBL47_09730 [Pectobacterium parmentieri]